jgi:glycyl-tRNA synthetase beta chain
VHRSVRKGEDTAALLPGITNEALKGLPIPKPMRWGAHEFTFVRPVHWLVMLLGDQVVEGEVLGQQSSRMSRGHRFHHPERLWIPNPEHYVDTLRKAYVMVDPVERRAVIKSALEDQARRAGGEAHAPDALLDEVTNLVEWPVPVTCAFDAEFLRVPPEALITTMESNQKFFPMFSADGTLTEIFIGIANIESRDPDQVRRGYERVIRPRFADAAFFFDQDMKTPLAAHQKLLEGVVYQQALGTLWDKTCRVAELARVIANRTGVDAALATHAAALSKCDLMTRMVGEFPELQGVMGRHYALAQGENPEVARALDECYAPRQAGAPIAQGAVARVLALAEKLDTLAGLFALGQKPGGNKDPFSLRRNALGLARTLIEGGIEIDLKALIAEAVTRIQDTVPQAASRRAESDVAAELYGFVLERLRGYYADQGLRGDAFEAVATLQPASLLDFDRRLRAVVAFGELPDAQSLAAANKRIGNILRQARQQGEGDPGSIDTTRYEHDAERALGSALASAGAKAQERVRGGDYVGALRELAALRPTVDAFFDQVMVMADDPGLRANRLALLQALRQQFLAIADIGALQAP